MENNKNKSKKKIEIIGIFGNPKLEQNKLMYRDIYKNCGFVFCTSFVEIIDNNDNVFHIPNED